MQLKILILYSFDILTKKVRNSLWVTCDLERKYVSTSIKKVTVVHD